MIAVIDYGMGNLRSVQKALEVSGAKAKITSDPKDIKRCDKIVFPGVGSFGDAVKELRRRGLDEAIKDSIARGKCFLGLCLGLQLLFETSQEAPGVNGLAIFKGDVKRFRFAKGEFKVPHMGWNSICRASGFRRRAAILDGVKDGSHMYFVHSYYVKPRDEKIALTSTEYGSDFASGVCSGNVYGFQFHPEKSQAMGLKILKNFVGLR